MTQNEIIELAIQGHASARDAIRWAMKQERETIYQLVMEAPFKEFDRQEEDFDGEAANAMKAMAFSLILEIRARSQND